MLIAINQDAAAAKVKYDEVSRSLKGLMMAVIVSDVQANIDEELDIGILSKLAYTIEKIFRRLNFFVPDYFPIHNH